MITNFIIGNTIKLELTSEGKTVLLALYKENEEMTFPLTSEETDVVIAALTFHKNKVEKNKGAKKTWEM